MDLTGVFTLLISAVAAYMSYRLGKLQVAESSRSTLLVDKTTGETEFRKSLLELIDQQEDKLVKQDNKIERLDKQVDDGKKLTDDLKRANFNLTLENERLTRMITSLEHELSILRAEVGKVKKKQLEQDEINDSHK